jgi:hypothetical protein
MPLDINDQLKIKNVNEASSAISKQMKGVLSAIQVEETYAKVLKATSDAQAARAKANAEGLGKKKAEEEYLNVLKNQLITVEDLTRAQNAANDVAMKLMASATASGKAVSSIKIEEAKQKAYNDTLNDTIESYQVTVKTIDEVVDSLESYSKEIEEAEKNTTFFGHANHEASSEAKNFAAGLGGTATGALAAGIAVVFAASKINELSERVAETAKEFAKFDIATRNLSNTSLVGDYEELEELRNELALTKNEGVDFFNVVKEGVSNGLASFDDLVEAGESLREAFGDDPTRNLQNFIDLLKEIPTLDTDISITASLDDQTAAWFALAEKGKVSQAIELQMAGLLGGEKKEGKEGIPEGDKEILKKLDEAQRIETDIQNAIASSFPPTVLKLGQIAGSTLKVGGGVFGVWIAAKAQIKLLQQILKVNEEIASKSGIGPVGGKTKGTGVSIRDKASLIKSTASRSFLGGYGKSKEAGSGFVRATMSGVKSAGGSISEVGAGLGGVTGSLVKGFGALTRVVGPAAVGLGAVAGVATAAISPFVLVGKYGETVGESLKDTAKYINDSSIGNVINGTVRVFSLGLFNASGYLKFWGNQLSQAGKAWSGVWSKMTSKLSDFVTSNSTLKAESEKAQATLDAALAERDLMVSLRKTQQSALHMEKALKLIDSAANSASTQLAKMNADVANLKLENLSIIGGTATDFAQAVQSGADAVTAGYGQQMRALKRARDMIIKDADMQPEMRAAALAKLHKAEMEAAATFMDGMLKMTGNFKDIPSVAQAELKAGIRNSMSGLETEVGSDLFDGSAFERNIANVQSSFAAAADISSQIGPDLARAQSAILEAQKSSPEKAEEMAAAIKDATNILKKATPDEASLAASLTDSLSIDLGEVKFKEGKEGIGAEIASKAQSKIDKLQKSIGDISPDELVTSFSKVSKEWEIAKQSKEQASEKSRDAADALNEAEFQAAGDTSKFANPNFERKKKIDEAIASKSSIGTNINKRNSEAITAQNELANVAVEEERLAKERVNLFESMVSLAKSSSSSAKKEIELAENDLKNAKKSNAKKEEIDKIETRIVNLSKRHLGSVSKERVAIQRRIEALKSIKDSAEKASALQKAQNDLLMLEKKSVESMVSSIKSVLASLDSLVAGVENDPTIVYMKRETELLKQKSELAMLNGKGAAEFAAGLQSETDTIRKQISIADRSIALLDEVSKGGDTMNKALENIGGTYETAKKSLHEIFMSGNDESKVGLTKTKIKRTDNSGKMVEEEVSFSDALDSQIDGMKESYSKLRAASKDGNKDQQKAAAEEIRAKRSAFNETLNAMKAIYKKNTGKEMDTSAIEAQFDSVQTVTIGLAGGVEKAKTQLLTSKNKFTKELQEIGHKWDDFISSLGSTEMQRTAKAAQEAASAQIELAIAYGDGAKAGEAFTAASMAITAGVEDMLKNLKDARDNAEKDFSAKRDKIKKDGGPEAAVALEATRLQYIKTMADITAQEESIKLKGLRDTVAASRQVVEAQNKSVEIASESIQDQVSFLEDIGGSYEEIFALKSKEIALQSQRVKSEQENVARIEALKAQGVNVEMDLMQARVDLQKAQNKLQKDSMTAQRDAYEKMVGMAFGAIRSSRGARKLMDQEARFVGRGKVQTSGGLYLQGKAKTLEAQKLEIGQKLAMEAPRKTGQEVASRELSVNVVNAALNGNKNQTAIDIANGTKQGMSAVTPALTEGTRQTGNDVKEGMKPMADGIGSLLDVQRRAAGSLGSIASSQAKMVGLMSSTTGINPVEKAAPETTSSDAVVNQAGIVESIRDLRAGIEIFNTTMKESKIDAGLKEVAISIKELKDGIELFDSKLSGKEKPVTEITSPLDAVEGLVRDLISGIDLASAETVTRVSPSEKPESGSDFKSALEEMSNTITDKVGIAIKDLRDGLDFVAAKLDLGNTMDSLFRELKDGIDFARSKTGNEATQGPQYPSENYAAILAKLSESALTPQRMDVAVDGRVTIEFNNNMFKSAVVDIVSRELGQTGALTTAFDQRYPAKGQ